MPASKGDFQGMIIISLASGYTCDEMTIHFTINNGNYFTIVNTIVITFT